ncbi:MAG: conjugal transfer protein TraR [Actinobacteria bacterium]|nr:MAG: conjugal transfer protein TraR [Actinomycetota bacterium]
METDVRNTAGQDWIESMRALLTDQFEAQSARLAELNVDTGEPGDVHNQAALVATTRQNLTQIKEALQRIEEGRFGICERCGGEIPRERLEILPHAKYCVPCQQRMSN